MVVSTLYSIRGIPAIDQGGLKKETANLFRVALWMPFWVFFFYNLLIVKNREKDIPGLTDIMVPHRLGPKKANKILKLLNLCKEGDVHQYVVTKPWNKEGKKPRNKASKIFSISLLHLFCHTIVSVLPWNSILTKNKEEASEYAKLLTKRMKEAKDKTPWTDCQEMKAVLSESIYV